MGGESGFGFAEFGGAAAADFGSEIQTTPVGEAGYSSRRSRKNSRGSVVVICCVITPLMPGRPAVRSCHVIKFVEDSRVYVTFVNPCQVRVTVLRAAAPSARNCGLTYGACVWTAGALRISYWVPALNVGGMV